MVLVHREKVVPTEPTETDSTCCAGVTGGDGEGADKNPIDATSGARCCGAVAKIPSSPVQNSYDLAHSKNISRISVA